MADDTIERLEAAQQAVLDELDALRRDVVDMQERLDFTERVLAQQRHQAALPGAEGSSPPSA